MPIGYVNGVATDSAGNVYFTDPLEHLLLRVAPNGTLTVVAGNGIAGYSGDGGPATSAAIAATDNPDQYVGAPFENSLGGIAIDQQGNIYFGDGHYVRRVGTDGNIATVAGGGTQSPKWRAGHGASLGIVNGLALDAAGNLYFCESNRIRKMTPGGTLTTYAGAAANGFSGDGGPASAALLSQPLGLAFDGQGNLYVADGDVANFPSRIREITLNGTISTIAGGGNNVPDQRRGAAEFEFGVCERAGRGCRKQSLCFCAEKRILAEDRRGRYDAGDQHVPRRHSPPMCPRATLTWWDNAIYDNSGIALDAAGNLYVADSRDGRLCKIDTHGILTTLAGTALMDSAAMAVPRSARSFRARRV